MIKFSRIVLEPTDMKRRGLDVFKVANDIDVYLNSSHFITIPEGFESDGASLPKWTRSKWKSWGKYSGPSLLHDYLLLTSKYPKWLIDALFYIALRCCNVPALEAAIFWMSVRIRRPKRSPPTTVPGVYSS